MKNTGKSVPQGAFQVATAPKTKWKKHQLRDIHLDVLASEEGRAPLAWRFSHLDQTGPFGWNEIKKTELEDLLKKLPEFETKSWDELQAAGCHTIEVTRLEIEARNRLGHLQHDDEDLLMSFRITGAKRLWCIKHGNIMRILWWDPQHRVYRTERDRADREKRRKRG